LTVPCETATRAFLFGRLDTQAHRRRGGQLCPLRPVGATSTVNGKEGNEVSGKSSNPPRERRSPRKASGLIGGAAVGAVGRALALLLALLALAAARPAYALTTITSDVTLPGDPVYGDSIDDDVLVGGVKLTINAGGSITGNVGGPVGAVTVSGGSIGGNLELGPGCRAIVTDGSIGGYARADHGGSVSLTISGGSIGGFVDAVDGSTVAISGGSIHGDVWATWGTANISGGSIDGGVHALGFGFAGSGTANISGGSIGGGVEVIGDIGASARISITGGSIGGSLIAQTNGSIHIYGCNLTLANGRLTGTLQSGSSINNPVVLNGGQILLHNADTTPPTLGSTSASPTVLWPPNHQWVNVTVNYTASDACGPVGTTLSISSNEPVNGQGDGDTAPDWQIVDAHHVLLRAERSGSGSGRVYTITITATDSAGLSASRQVTVGVPKS
jgi:hypothetical protein